MSLGIVVELVATLSTGWLATGLGSLTAILSCSAPESEAEADTWRFSAETAALVGMSDSSFLGEDGVASSSTFLFSVLLGQSPFRDMRSRISSKLGRPLASMRFLGEQAPEQGALGDAHAIDSPLFGESGIKGGLLRST